MQIWVILYRHALTADVDNPWTRQAASFDLQIIRGAKPCIPGCRIPISAYTICFRVGTSDIVEHPFPVPIIYQTLRHTAMRSPNDSPIGYILRRAYYTNSQWRRQLWVTGARAPSTSKSESQLSKYCVVCEISWCRCQQLTALSISIGLVY